MLPVSCSIFCPLLTRPARKEKRPKIVFIGDKSDGHKPRTAHGVCLLLWNLLKGKVPYIWLGIERSRHTPCAVVFNSVGVGTGIGLDRVDQDLKTHGKSGKNDLGHAG